MKIIKREVKTYNVAAHCDCGGIMVYTGMMLASNPPQFPHKCEDCGKDEVLDKTYPRTDYGFVE